MRRHGGGQGCSVGVRSSNGEEEMRAGEVRDSLGVIGVAFIGSGEGCWGNEGGITANEGGGFNGRVNRLITAG
jgi:hypothetical protein